MIKPKEASCNFLDKLFASTTLVSFLDIIIFHIFASKKKILLDLLEHRLSVSEDWVIDCWLAILSMKTLKFSLYGYKICSEQSFFLLCCFLLRFDLFPFLFHANFFFFCNFWSTTFLCSHFATHF